MAGWHTRLWRRVKVAPGVTINFSKSGPSMSVGPRGAKMTFGRRGVRQTVGIPGTGLYASRQLVGRPSPPARSPASVSPSGTATQPRPAILETALPPDAADGATATPSTESGSTTPDEVVLYFGFATVVGVVFGILLLVIGLPSNQALVGGGLAVIAGIAYEGLAHHHPGPAKAVVAVTVGLISIAAALLAVVAIAVVGVALLGLGGSARSRRRRPW